jgi:hypothetical protein
METSCALSEKSDYLVHSYRSAFANRGFRQRGRHSLRGHPDRLLVSPIARASLHHRPRPFAGGFAPIFVCF